MKEQPEKKDFGREQHQAGKAFEAQAHQANKAFEQQAGAFNDQFNAFSGGAMRSYEELAEMGRENAEAMLRVGVAWAKGMEELSRAWSDMTKRVVSMQTDAASALVGCRNLKDVVDIQTGLVRDQIETAVNEGTRISELSIKLANEAIQPLSERANANAKKATRMTSAVAA